MYCVLLTLCEIVIILTGPTHFSPSYGPRTGFFRIDSTYIHIYVITKTLCDCKWLKVTISADYANIFCNIETLSLFDKSWYKVDNIYKILRVLVFKCSSQARFTYKLLQHCFIKLGKGFGLCHGSHVIQSKPETKIFQFLKNRENESCQSYSNNSKSLW